MNTLSVEKTHLGVVLERWMKAHEVTAEMFCDKSGIQPDLLDGLLQRKLTVTKKIANQLSNVCGTRKEWLELQSDYNGSR